MYTIKHVEATGHEHVFPCTHAGYQPDMMQPNSNVPVRAQVFAFGVPGPDEGAKINGCLTFDCGLVYVMNDSGKTVARYHLGQHDIPAGIGSPLVAPPRLRTQRDYPCGCSAAGEGDIPSYCPTHGTVPGTAIR